MTASSRSFSFQVRVVIRLVPRSCMEGSQCRSIEIGMKMQQIFAGSIVGLLLAVSPLAVACELSCAFSSMGSDCHSAQKDSQSLASAGMNMDGMNMARTDMPETPGEMGQPSYSAISRAHAAHPSIGDMGPCEKQACDSRSAISEKSSRLGDWNFQLLFAAAGAPRADAAPALFCVARDEITRQFSVDGSSLHLNLRI